MADSKSPVRKDFPAFSDKEWQRARKRSLSSLKVSHGDKMEDVNEKLEKCTLDGNRDLCEDTDELSIVLIGKTGSGKSATANCLLKEEIFEQDFASLSVTKTSKKVTKNVDGRKLNIVDTPGLADTGKDAAYIRKEIARFADFLPDGVHAFIYVMNMTAFRFTDEDQKVFDHIKELFGGKFESYCLLVFSHGGDVNLQDYYDSETTKGSPLGNFLIKLDGKVLAVDSVTDSAYENDQHRKNILGMVDKITGNNKPNAYTNKYFQRAQEERKAYHLRALKEGWDPSVMETVESIIGMNPQISRKELEERVQKKLREDMEEAKKREKAIEEKVRKEFLRREEKLERERIEDRKLQDQKFAAMMKQITDMQVRELQEKNHVLEQQAQYRATTEMRHIREAEEAVRRKEAAEEARRRAEKAAEEIARKESQVNHMVQERKGIFSRLWSWIAG